MKIRLKQQSVFYQILRGVLGLLFILLSQNSKAETVQIEFDGAINKVFFDMDTGFLYVAGDCEPLLKFKETPASRSKVSKKRVFTVNSVQSRSTRKSQRSTRMPRSLVFDDLSVSLETGSLYGKHSSRGRVIPKSISKARPRSCQ